MKKCAVLCLVFLILSGCSGDSDPLEAGLQLRSSLLQASECSFDADITADYGDKVHNFTMQCIADAEGTVTFTVSEPETISGITGKLSGDEGRLIFDDISLHFPLLAEEQLSPVSAPWVLISTLRKGNMVSAGEDESRVWLSVDDRYDSDALRLDIRLNEAGMPEFAEILYDGRRILSVAVANFEIL